MNTKMETPTNFGDNLRKIRKRKGYTRAQLAELSGISSRMIGHYETVIKRPSIDKIQLLAEALRVSVDELLGTAEPSRKAKNANEVSYKILKKVRLIEELPVRYQNAIFQHINAMVELHRNRQQTGAKRKK